MSILKIPSPTVQTLISNSLIEASRFEPPIIEFNSDGYKDDLKYFWYYEYKIIFAGIFSSASCYPADILALCYFDLFKYTTDFEYEEGTDKINYKDGASSGIGLGATSMSDAQKTRDFLYSDFMKQNPNLSIFANNRYGLALLAMYSTKRLGYPNFKNGSTGSR